MQLASRNDQLITKRAKARQTIELGGRPSTTKLIKTNEDSLRERHTIRRLFRKLEGLSKC